jgi:hypothetical protein
MARPAVMRHINAIAERGVQEDLAPLSREFLLVDMHSATLAHRFISRRMGTDEPRMSALGTAFSAAGLFQDRLSWLNAVSPAVFHHSRQSSRANRMRYCPGQRAIKKDLPRIMI